MRKVLFNTWTGAFFKAGGGEVQLLNSKRALEDIGYSVSLFDQWKPPTDFSILHQFSIETGTEHVVRSYKELGKKVAVSTILWDKIPTEDPHYYRIKSIFQMADLLLTNSDMESRRLSDHFNIPSKKFLKTRNAVSLEYFSQGQADYFRNEFQISEKFILTVANIDRRKNTKRLVEACAKLEIPLISIGHIKDTQYFNEFKGANHFRHLGPIFDVELLKSAYSACEAFVLPSLCETPGIAALEAGSQGARLVLTQEGSAREYFGSLATYVDPNDVQSICEGVVEGLASETQSLVKDHVRLNFSWDQAGRDIAVAYEQL